MRAGACSRRSDRGATCAHGVRRVHDRDDPVLGHAPADAEVVVVVLDVLARDGGEQLGGVRNVAGQLCAFKDLKRSKRVACPGSGPQTAPESNRAP